MRYIDNNYTICQNFKDPSDDNNYINILNSDGPIVKAVARFLYFAQCQY